MIRDHEFELMLWEDVPCRVIADYQCDVPPVAGETGVAEYALIKEVWIGCNGPNIYKALTPDQLEMIEELCKKEAANQLAHAKD